MRESNRDPALQRAIDAVGSAAAVGRLFGISGQAVSQWLICPPERVIRLAQASGVSREALRPDLYNFPAEAETRPSEESSAAAA